MAPGPTFPDEAYSWVQTNSLRRRPRALRPLWNAHPSPLHRNFLAPLAAGHAQSLVQVALRVDG